MLYVRVNVSPFSPALGYISVKRARRRSDVSADIRIPDGAAPSVNNSSMSKSNPTDVWYTWSLLNVGDEDGDTNGYRWALQDPNGTTSAGDNVPLVNVAPGSTIEQGANIPASSFSSEGTYWANLMDPSGSNLGGARIDVSA
jgi:hypothetical protein